MQAKELSAVHIGRMVRATGIWPDWTGKVTRRSEGVWDFRVKGVKHNDYSGALRTFVDVFTPVGDERGGYVSLDPETEVELLKH